MSGSLRLLAALSLPVVLVLSSCGDDTVDPSSSSPTSSTPTSSTPTSSASPIELDGHEYLSTSSDGFEIVDGSVIGISFADGQMSASPGCNSMTNGHYTTDDSSFSVELVGMTEMGCDQPLMDQDARFSEFLLGPLTIALVGDELTLTSPAASITFLDREVADPDRPLEGTRWEIDTVISGESASTIPIGAVASMTIVDGVAQIETGCNTGSASVTVADDTITFGPLGLTKMACAPELMDLENAVVATLAGPVTYTIEASRLMVTAREGGLGFLAES